MCLVVAGGFRCHAQTAAANQPLTQAQINSRIEVIVRTHFDIPSDATIQVGPKGKSDLPGYHVVPVTVMQGKTVDGPFFFELSDDGTTFAKMDRYDLLQNPKDLIPTAGRPSRGPADAPVTIVVFDDLECPFCSQLYHELFPDAMTHYNGKLHIVYKDFPLQPIHPWAMHAAVDANCLLAQSEAGYWNFVDYAHTHGTDITGDRKPETASAALDKLATDEGALQKVNLEVLAACVAKQDKTAILASIDQGHALHVSPTPTLFINGEKVEGAIPEEDLWKVIDRAMAGAVAPPAK